MKEVIARSKAIRDRYHQLEIQQNGQSWSAEQDALAFLTDAALVGRFVMDKEASWPTSQTDTSLSYKIGETMW
ncbi:MazG-like protein [Enterococcus sp. RIT-PI-f]|uniref:MazG-like protein n=1 Tax=Enterococcus sp. RIT-PI-f TaxID=1690244 RepID=UPI001F1B04FF|nr:MazG-like protein [Enterococcus sp. RIT-PI-f]